MGKILLLIVVAVTINAAVLPFDKEAVERIFQSKQPALFLFTNDNEASQSAQKAFSDYETTNPEGFILTQTDKNDGHGFFDRLAEYLGVNT